MEEATSLKAEGNRLFAEKRWADATVKYSEALVKLEAAGDAAGPDGKTLRVSLLSNRAACHLAVENFSECLEDCNAVLKLDLSHQKALFRRAQALDGLGRPRDALADVMSLLAKHPKNKAASKLSRKLANKLQLKDAAAQDTTSSALALLQDTSQPIEVIEQQCRIISFSVRTGDEWAQRIVSKGGIETMWAVAARFPQATEVVDALSAIAKHEKFQSRFQNQDWSLFERQLLRNEIVFGDASSGPTSTASKESKKDSHDDDDDDDDDDDAPQLPTAKSKTTSAPPTPTPTATADDNTVTAARFSAVLQLWSSVVVPDPARLEQEMYKTKPGPASIKPADLMPQVTNLEKDCLGGVRRAFNMPLVSGGKINPAVEAAQRVALDSVIRLTSLPRLVRIRPCGVVPCCCYSHSAPPNCISTVNNLL